MQKKKKSVCASMTKEESVWMFLVDVTATLRAGMSGHPPLVMGIQQGSAGTEETRIQLLQRRQKLAGTISRFCLRITD